MDYQPIIDKNVARLAELDEAMATPGFYDDNRAAATVMREHAHLRKIGELWDEWKTVTADVAAAEEMVKSDDQEMVEMGREELALLRDKPEKLAVDLQYALLPRDPSEDRDAILEIRAGVGGDEAALFAADLCKLYTRYSEARGWKIETLDLSESDGGGLKDITMKVSGQEVFRTLKYESGVHRVQRVPATETQGRIHTSTATIAVLPEAEEVDVELRPEDLKIEACRASGPGGQGVNTTDSAVQVWHHPTGLYVKCKEGRSQNQNKERALQILRAKILEHAQQEEEAKYSAQRKSLIGGGGREEKIRTYNFPQNRVTDHRINLTLHNLDAVMAGGIEDLTERLQAVEMEERLKEAGLGDGEA